MDYLTVHRLSLLNGFIFVSVCFHFQFSKSFSSSVMSVPYSYLLLSTPLLVCFLMNQPHYHRFSVFRFHKILVRMHCTKLAVRVIFLVQSLYHIVSYRTDEVQCR